MVSITDRIKQVEKFLKDQEETPKTPEVPLTPAPILTPAPAVAPALALNDNVEVIGLLRRMLINQLIERREYERSHVLIDDSPIYDFAEETIDPGFMVTFTLTIAEGRIFFFEYFNITYNEDTIYNLYIDGVGPGTLPTLTDVLQDFGDHNIMFSPPRLCYQNVIITATNVGAIAQTYSVFMRGWFRQSVKIDQEYLGSR